MANSRVYEIQIAHRPMKDFPDDYFDIATNDYCKKEYFKLINEAALIKKEIFSNEKMKKEFNFLLKLTKRGYLGLFSSTRKDIDEAELLTSNSISILEYNSHHTVVLLNSFKEFLFTTFDKWYPGVSYSYHSFDLFYTEYLTLKELIKFKLNKPNKYKLYIEVLSIKHSLRTEHHVGGRRINQFIDDEKFTKLMIELSRLLARATDLRPISFGIKNDDRKLAWKIMQRYMRQPQYKYTFTI